MSKAKLNPLLLVQIAVIVALLSFDSFGGQLKTVELKCEYQDNPIGIDIERPRLSWVIESTERGEGQTAFEILVASSKAKLAADEADLWSSGKTTSEQTTFISYAGKPLASRQDCFWKVRSWGRSGKVSEWSKMAHWQMGLLSPGDWQAKWIAQNTNIDQQPAPFFRSELALSGKVKRAIVSVCGLGYYELHINGRVVGNQTLDPGYTRYDKRVLYATHDVTKLLKRGTNALGVILGNGWFNVQTKAVWNFHDAPWRQSPRLLLSLFVEYADGRTQIFGSDESWRTTTGPILFNSIYGGENYDARLDMPGWDKPGFDDARWQRVILAEPPKGRLCAQIMPPISQTQILKPVKLTKPKPGVFIFDFGQNFSGYTELQARGPAGTKIILRHGERLKADGTLDIADIDCHVRKMGAGQQFQTSEYIMRGQTTEKWHPRFTYYGFQYVEITGFPGKPTIDSLRGVFTHSDVSSAGDFHCSNPLFNKIWTATRWSYLSNLQGIPTDCPQREKNGWMGDAHLAAEQGIFNYSPGAIYTKWLNDIDDEQQPDGRLPGIVPTGGWGYAWGNGPAWDSAFELIPFYLYEYYGDSQPLCDHYAGMKRYVDYLTARAKDNIINIGLNDWAPAKTKTPADITDTAYFYCDTKIVALTARLLGKNDEAEEYTRRAEQIKNSFNQKFFHADTASYGNGSQTSLSCALYQGLVDPTQENRVLDNLVQNVERHNGHIDTGILGAKYLLNTLTDHGRADVAYRIASQTNMPSWGFWISKGATTLWECWDGGASHNHIMYGDISAWFYKTLAGINPDPNAPGFKHFFISPHPVGGLTFACGEYKSIHGKIVSDWQVKDGKFRLHVIVPANTTATVRIPGVKLNEVREGWGAATKACGVTSFAQSGEAAIFEVASGEYRFSAPFQGRF